MSNIDRRKPIIHEGGFVRMDNRISLYNLLGYHSDKSLQVQPATLDIYRKLREHKHNCEGSYNHGKTWMSYERLSVELSISSKTVSKHVGILEKVGLVSIERKYRNNRRNYMITINEPMSEPEFRAAYPEVIDKYYEELGKILDDREGWNP